ncbi:MAG: hypothetical protein B0D88_00035 [Candidatus Sedimenticola endophacoides]|nr:MAG: hypothetical protein B0D88_00035 [Candidatus Sedimenticola endophacoides]OQX46963.1 MAG: hypothetical protein B0D85_02580 [Candidatus Sedimenticola endophacoides]OQX48322.1 MAG: hypothetical protein B0D87_06290 [Candidatus Sedimenticola endophacoides]
MFKPLAMKHVVLQILTEDLQQASLTLARLGLFNPDHRPFERERFPKIPGERYRELHAQAHTRLEKIRRQIGLATEVRLNELHVVGERELEETNDWLGQVWERCSGFEESARRMAAEERSLEQLQQTLADFDQLNIDLDLLQGEKRFLDIHLGVVPRQNIRQLREALSLAGYLLFTHAESGDNSHTVIVGARQEDNREIISVLDTAGFRALTIPSQLREEPDRVRTELQAQQRALDEQRRSESASMSLCSAELRERLEQSQRILLMAEPFVHLRGAARSTGALTIVTGWIPSREIRRTEQALKAALANPFLLSARAPRPEERHLVPSYLPKGRFSQPFATLVKQYGIPRYGEVDPTAIFTLTFIAMFGMMFGDIGHGLTIMLGAWLARSRLKSFTLFALAAGASSTLFGALYGSIFGYEELFHALWIPPLSDPLYMLSMALAWGVGFLIIITLISIHNRLVEGDLHRALFDTNGLVSIILYLSVLGGVYGIYTQGAYGVATAVISIGALLTLLGFKLIETQASPGERMLVAFIETFETLTGYTSNTLSFLRVAAFSLNHVALAIAVFTLADMLEGTGHWLMIIAGNLFILILEGAIVTIQALRLEYYEGFSRFFSGDGLEFKPLKLSGGGGG